MVRRRVVPFFVLTASLMLFACGEKLELEVKAGMMGKPADQAKVSVDGEEQGFTNEQGNFSKVIRKKPGAEVEVAVSKEAAGYRIQPWKGSFLMKLPRKGAVDKYSFDAELKATRYVTIVAAEAGSPVSEAVVKAFGKEAGRTDAKGEFVYEYESLPQTGADLSVTKPGYTLWRKTGALEPGQRLEASLSKRVVVTVTALMEEYGQTAVVPGVIVSIDKKKAGRTDSKGTFIYTYDGEPGRKVQLSLSAAGYIPANWKTTITLEGEASVQRYFYPTTPKPIRVGIYRFVSNTPGIDLKEVLNQTETAVAGQLFKNACFREVQSKALQAEIKQARLSIEKIIVKGWRETPLRRTVDMIVLGSVAKDEKGFLLETKFYTSGGKLILSQINRAKSAGDIGGAARVIAENIMERFPFEGTVVSSDDDRYRINIGKGGYKIKKGMEFSLMAARLDESGKVSSYRDIGLLKVKKSEEAGAWTEVDALKKGEKIGIGDRVIRRIPREDEDQDKHSFILSAKGGVPPDVSPLAGVNIYFNEEWIGATGPDGRAEVPVRLGKKYDMVLYRHGYQQLSEKLKVEKSGEAKEFVLQANNSVFKIDSRPSSAEVYVDGDRIGKTPLLDGKLVTLGFHTVKVALGGDYRDWEEVVEFAKKAEDRTGDNSIVLHKDYLRIGERAERNGNIDDAIQAYKATEKGHPDYSTAHHRLAQIYLDEKNDYNSAIAEFESVLSLPENQQLIYKQYAVAFTNLGHAYYEKGNELVNSDKDEAANAFANAIQKLQIAKQNTRFFPNQEYDEAVHDTYYYLAIAYHKLYLITKKNAILSSANLAWREYFDFFPKNLEGKKEFDQSRDSAQKYWDQIKDMM